MIQFTSQLWSSGLAYITPIAIYSHDYMPIPCTFCFYLQKRHSHKDNLVSCMWLLRWAVAMLSSRGEMSSPLEFCYPSSSSDSFIAFSTTGFLLMLVLAWPNSSDSQWACSISSLTKAQKDGALYVLMTANGPSRGRSLRESWIKAGLTDWNWSLSVRHAAVHDVIVPQSTKIHW